MSWNLNWKWGAHVAKKAKKRDDRLPTIPKRRKPQDATMRNVRSANARLGRLTATLEQELVPTLRALERRIAVLERWREATDEPGR